MPRSQPPFVLPPPGWRARAAALLAGPGRQAAALAVLCLLALAAAAVVWVRAQPRPEPAPLGVHGGQALAGSPPERSLAVHVAGQVRRAGLVELPPGSRVADALRAAGGPLPGADLDAVNLARKLADGEQVRVPARGEAPAGAAAPPLPGAAGSPPAPGGLVNLNTATLAELEALPGVGQVTAERIIAYRTAHPFTSVEELRQVEGIGERRYETLKGLVTV